MKNLNVFIKEENGDVVQYIIVLAVIAIILAFAFPKIKEKMSDATSGTMNDMDSALTDM